MMDVSILIQRSLHIEQPDMDSAISLLNVFKNIELNSVMLKKHPDIVSVIG